MNTRRLFLSLALGLTTGLAALASVSAHAQAYPSKYITLIVPTAPGGPTDVVARIMAQRVGEQLGQSVVILNVGGNGGLIGTEQAVRAKPDGYTLYFGFNSLATFPSLRPANNPLPFDPEHDLVPVGGIAASANVFVVRKSLGVKTLPELLALAKQKPESISYGTAGVGGTMHLPPALVAHRAGVSLLHVPFKGAGPAMQELVAGRISMAVPGYSASLDSYIKDGTLVPLAVTSAERLPFLPNVPTLAESGYPGYVFPIWYGVFAPKGTPAAVVATFTGAMEKVAKDPDFVQKLSAQGNVARYLNPEQQAQLLKDDTVRVSAQIRASGISFAGAQ
jgi:tripartite-type tricarboxylate transporter receptor subunit TctC